MERLGYLYEHGKGVPEDYGEAMKWYLRAADAGNVEAMYAVGLLYEAGKGVNRNLEEAKNWFTRAGQFGYKGVGQSLPQLGSSAK